MHLRRETNMEVIPFPKRSDWEPWLTKKQLSAILGFCTRWIEYRVSDGMPVHKIGGRCMFRLSEVEEWLKKEQAR
jgi:phage terminase Nu1 subunit (DNA packaging protein)